ncbi:hypothetical protein J5J83_14050 [Azoarcus sp. L1K30]|uniref:hypothetical protein n=1 Tax=Azoarcus sp. L1K30 TaxID=2820277 RepID=UPI001B840BF5|nr:hypothetical protein [Azoarcus sp. L1K30]MBR0567242.1 hypothetical protein [Azoarcus sp. L1K30]
MKKTSSYRSRIVTGAMLIAVGMLSACSNMPPLSSAPEDIVKFRAQQRWDAHVAGEWETVYSFATPSYRALRPFVHFRGTIGSAVSWTKAEVVSVECAEEACSARVKLDFRSAVRPGVSEESSTYISEKWVLEDGQWYFHPKR